MIQPRFKRYPAVAVRFVVVAAAWLISATSIAADDLPFDVTVTAKSTPVMAGEKSIGKVLKDARLTVTKTNGEWYLVDLPSANPPQHGWICKSDVQLSTVAVTAAQLPPAQLTPEQKHERLEERDRYGDEARKLNAEGKYDEAIAVAEKMQAIEREVLGSNDPDTIGSGRYLSTLHLAKEDIAGARKICEEELATRTNLLGNNHWEVIDARVALADVNTWAALKPEDRQALARCDTVLAKARNLGAAGDAKSALPLVNEVLETRTRLLGPKHHLTGIACSYLGVIYEHLGQSADAIKFASLALDIIREAYGENDPNYATSLDNLAVLYRENADYAKAEPLCLQALQIRKELLGEKDPSYARSLNNLAWLYELSATTPRQSRSCLKALKSASKHWGKSTTIMPKVCVAWPCCIKRWANTPRPSRSTSKCWKSTNRRWAKSIPTMPST